MVVDVQTPLLEGHDDVDRRSWSGERLPADAPPANGSVQASSINLSACALGASMLSLPYTMLVSGPIVSLEFLLLFAIMAYISSQSIISAGIATKKSTYSAIVHHFFGSTCGIFVDVLLSIALMVAAISYIVGLADLLPGMLPFMSVFSRSMRIILTIVVLYPVTLTGSLAAFGPASSLAVGGCYLLALSLIFETLTTTSEWTSPQFSTWTGFSLSGLIYSLPMICFVYAFHYVETDTLNELSNATQNRLKNVSKYTTLILYLCYLPVSISGYLLLSGSNISSNVLADLPPTSITVLIAKWSIGLLLLITYSLFIIPLRRKIESILFHSLSTSFFHSNRLLVAAILNVIVAIISVTLPDLGFANSLAGGCIALIMFLFPGLFIVKIQFDKPPASRNPFQIAIGCIFVFFGALISFVGLFGNLIFSY